MRDEIARREQDGELGPGRRSILRRCTRRSCRDAQSSIPGRRGSRKPARRGWVGYLYAVALSAQVLDRELSGYMLDPESDARA